MGKIPNWMNKFDQAAGDVFDYAEAAAGAALKRVGEWAGYGQPAPKSIGEFAEKQLEHFKEFTGYNTLESFSHEIQNPPEDFGVDVSTANWLGERAMELVDVGSAAAVPWAAGKAAMAARATGGMRPVGADIYRRLVEEATDPQRTSGALKGLAESAAHHGRQMPGRVMMQLRKKGVPRKFAKRLMPTLEAIGEGIAQTGGAPYRAQQLYKNLMAPSDLLP